MGLADSPAGISRYVLGGRARNNIPAAADARVPPARVLVMKRKYTGIPLRMDAGQPGHANHAI
jgi:hypothetical protein